MAKKMTLEELMMPLIDDAANVFYSKLVSVLDALWGQTFIYRQWCGWHRHRVLGVKWKYGSFSSYTSDRKCIISLNDIPIDRMTSNKMYLRAVYHLDLTKVLVDTTESISNTGGAPVPTYRIDPDIPITLIGYSLSNKSSDVLYGDGIGNECYTTDSEGHLKDVVPEKKLNRPYITFLLGSVVNVANRVIEFDPVYKNGMLPFDEHGFNINKKTTIYPANTPLSQVPDLTQGTKYEWDCGRVMEFSIGRSKPRYWTYYSLDSDGTRWELESSKRAASQTPTSALPFLSSLYDVEYLMNGACFKTESIGDGEYRITIWKMRSHVYPKTHADMFMKMTPYKMHKQYTKTKNGKKAIIGIHRSEIDKLSKATCKVLYATHVPPMENTDFFKNVFDNSVLFTDMKLINKSAYDIASNYSRYIVNEISCNYLLMLILSVSNVSAHYLLSSTSLLWRIASPQHIENLNKRRKFSNREVMMFSKYSVCAPNNPNDGSGEEIQLKWQNIWTPYIFVMNGDSDTYKANGGTLCKFVNLGTEEEPKFYRVDRVSNTPDDYGPDRIGGENAHVFHVNVWNSDDINEYSPTHVLDVTIPGYFMEKFATHTPRGISNPATEPTKGLSQRWYYFIKSLAELTSERGYVGSVKLPVQKSCYIEPESFGIFLRQSTIGSGIKFEEREFNGICYLIAT